ncbi:TIR and AAA domain-containing protein [Kutzneria sp. 744]|uniref:TIR and AAA domain-containing protein n=1 Tax=Kutzneria sp. (strain 744) TaxID=345341 RepID=UPI0003EEDEF7|nr:TIR and AAA domain-containing protein [Kutzneria sp. 744]EWM15970.1 LigA protein [Kutzneria sp. 744]
MAHDVFLSYCRSDTTPAEALAAELRARGLRVFQDEVGVHRFDSVSRTILAELGRSRLLLAYYSQTYPTRRACQQELITAFLAGQREGDPLRRVLVVNPERGTGHIEPIELRDARFWSPSAELRHLTEAVTRKVDELPTTIGAVDHGRVPLSLPAPGHRPPPKFVGRTAELWRLHSALHPQSATLTEGGGEPVAVVHGVGGIGTSSLVAEYARQFGATFPGGVFWLSAGDPWPEQLTAIAEALGANGNGHAADRVALALDRSREPSLWVVDGVPAGLELDEVRRLLSPHPTAASVLTTTDASYAELGTGVPVPELPAAQAIKLVLNQVETLAPGDRESAHKLVDAVGGHPGALLDLAGSARSAGLDSVRRRLFSRDWPVLEATAKRLLAEVDAAGDAGLDVLRAVAAFAPEPMPLPVLDGLGPVGLAVDRLARQSVVRLVGGGALEVPAVVAHVIGTAIPIRRGTSGSARPRWPAAASGTTSRWTNASGRRRSGSRSSWRTGFPCGRWAAAACGRRSPPCTASSRSPGSSCGNAAPIRRSASVRSRSA